MREIDLLLLEDLEMHGNSHPDAPIGTRVLRIGGLLIVFALLSIMFMHSLTRVNTAVAAAPWAETMESASSATGGFAGVP